MGEDFDYAEEFKSLDVEALKRRRHRGDDDLAGLVARRLRPLRPAVHPDDLARRRHLPHRRRPRRRRQGAQRFAPLNSWPDNANLDKARRLLWPVKQKYGQTISWADLLVFAGNCALESMGFKTFGFGFGREDVWEPEEIFWGPEDTWLGDERYSGDRELAGPLGRRADGPDLRQPGGPERQTRPARRGARHPRDLPPDGDERRGDGRADRRRPHVRQDPRRRPRATTSAPSPRPRRSSSRGSAGRTPTAPARARTRSPAASRSTWTADADQVGQRFFENLFDYEWELTKSPAGAKQWKAKDAEADDRPTRRTRTTARRPTMLTTDLALRVDPVYETISRRFLEHPDEFAAAFAKAWYKLLHRDMGPVSRYLGPWVPEPQLWQDPVPAVDHELDRRRGHRGLKAKVLDSGLSVSAAGRDRLGGGGDLPRHRQARRRQRRAHPARAAEGLGGQRPGRAGARCSTILEQIQQDFNGSQSGGKQVSLADLIVLGGCAAVEKAAQGRRARRHGAVRARAHRRLAGADRRRVVRRARAAGRRVPQLPAGRARSCRRRPCCSTGPTC